MRAEPRQPQGRSRRSTVKPDEYEIVRVTVKEEKRLAASGLKNDKEDSDSKNDKEAAQESSEYTYEYESSSPMADAEDQGIGPGKRKTGAAPVVKREQEQKTATKTAPVAKAGAAQGKAAVAAAKAGDQLGTHAAPDRRARMFNELLKTAMETAANLER